MNITTGGAPWMTVEERVRPAAAFEPEVASLTMGSMSFGLGRGASGRRTRFSSSGAKCWNQG